MESNYPSIFIKIPGEPVAKGRPRFRIFSKGKKIRASAYTPEKTVAFEKLVRGEVKLVMDQLHLKPLIGLVQVEIKAYWEWPKSKHRKTKPLPECLHNSKPDPDNILKSVLDGMNGTVYGDDKQVAIVRLEKWRARQGDVARTEITITSLDKEWQLPEENNVTEDNQRIA